MSTIVARPGRQRRPFRRVSRPATLRVVLADSFKMSLDALGAALAGEDGIRLEGAASDHEAVPELVRDTRPEVLVIDHRIAQRIPKAAWAQMAKAAPNTSALLIAEDEAVEVAAALAQPEVKGVVSRTDDFATLLHAIRAVSEGRTWKMPAARSPKRRRAAVAGLSRRESEIAELVAKGLGNRDIAERLELTEQSVKNLVTRVLRKLGLRNRVQICLWKNSEGSS